jgi:hypothetical protein
MNRTMHQVIELYQGFARALARTDDPVVQPR